MLIHDRAAELIRDIERAFAEVPYPGDETIDNNHCLECRERADLFRGKDWRSLRLEELSASALGFFRAEAFHYFIPCFLIPALRARHHQDHASQAVPNATDSVLALLSVPGDRLDPFNGAQLHLLRRWLEFMRDEANPCGRDPDERIEAALHNVLARLAAGPDSSRGG